jgi:transposase
MLELILLRSQVPPFSLNPQPIRHYLGAHRPKRVRELIEQRGCELLYLPSYSLDYNPIEEAFAELKHLLRKACAGTKEALMEAIAEALSAISAQDARGFFEHAGYRPTAHLL